jgi:LAO/AO transport system kinase
MILCEAAGYDVILVETVGVGQSEFEVASMVDCFLVLMLPGAGDSLQGIKRGIMEIIDILVINKADGEQEKMAKNAISEYQNAFHMLTPKYKDIEVGFLTVSSTKKLRIDLAWEKVEEFITALKKQGIFETQRKEQELDWFKRLVEDEVLRVLWNSKENKPIVVNLMEKIKNNNISPSKAAKELLDKI